MREVVLTSAVRTPIGDFNGSLAGIDANRLGAIVIEEAINRSGIKKEDVDEVIMGMVLPCGLGQNPARQAAVKAGMPWEVQCLTVNKVCGSGLKSVMLAAQAIALGDADVIVAGGMESMSRAPYYLDKARFGYRMGSGTINDHMVHDGLWDIVNDFHMGMSNELVIDRYTVSREDQDRYALRSHERALNAIMKGLFREEIVPVKVPQKKGEPKIFDTDEHPRETSMEALAQLKPVFKAGGKTTAGNASAISDGASATVVMAREKAKELGCPELAVIRSQASAGIDMKFILVAPTLAIPKVLKKEGIKIEDVDLFEINEAFAGSTVAVIRELGIDMEKVNVNGGAIALGHPIGASGSRVLTTLIYEMMRRNSKIGLASLCLGGGEAVALIVRRDV
ncbi:MAG TPA: acetyl-CoA C-acetyltransferase [Deltaproteobacteria bacterium]|nr:acetyl-CoA C-acetyltransferase [Deltaproteobacteria bacterium]